MREWEMGFGGEVVVMGWLSTVELGCEVLFLLRVVGCCIWREEYVCGGKGPERGKSS